MTGRLKLFLKNTLATDEQQLDKIVKCFKPKTIKRNTILLSAGEVCKEIYFIHRGCLRTYYMTKQGQEKTRHIAFDGSIATSIASFISQQTSMEFVEALEDSELYAISHKDFYQLVINIPEWAKFYIKLLEMAYIYQNKKIENLVTLSAKQRYDQLFIEYPMYIQRISNKILASHLDITQETLSRIKSK